MPFSFCDSVNWYHSFINEFGNMYLKILRIYKAIVLIIPFLRIYYKDRDKLDTKMLVTAIIRIQLKAWQYEKNIYIYSNGYKDYVTIRENAYYILSEKM